MERPRLLLLTTAHSYRNEAFRAGAEAAGVDVVVGYDAPQVAAHAPALSPAHFSGQPAEGLPGEQPKIWPEGPLEGSPKNLPASLLASGPDSVPEPQRDRFPLDFSDPQAAAAVVMAHAQGQPLAAVLPVDDSGVLAAAAVALALDVPCNSPAAAEAARDKYIMRTLMAQAGVPCPWFRRYTLDLRAGFQEARRQEAVAAGLAVIAREVPYPCVLKPTTLNGSRGVMRADNPTEFVARGLQLAQLLQREFGAGEHPFLVEAFLPGVEVALEGILDVPRQPPTNNASDGNSGGGAERAPELTVLALFDKPDPLDGPFFEETIYVTPSRLPATVQAAIARCAAAAAAAIGLRTGPIHAELRVNDTGPWMLEIAGRSIGGLCGRTLRFGLAGGMTLEELIVRQVCGLPWREAVSSATGVQDASLQPVGQASGVMMIPIPEAGQLRAVDGVAAAEAVPGIEGVEISVALHHAVTPLPEGESYLGFIFARGATPAAVEASLRTAHACLRFTIVPEIGLLG